VGSNSVTYTDAALENGDIITCVLTSNNACAAPVTATSTGITMIVAASTNANLSALTTTAGTVTPTFAAATTSYAAGVTNGTSTVTVTPTRSQANATIQVRVNGGSYSSVTSGSASTALSLNVGSNTIDVTVTAQDGTTIKTYIITVTRETITWLGGSSSDFSNPANWSGGAVPTVVNDFVVATSSNNPIITGTHTVNNFTINSGATLTVTGTIKIAGSITNSGIVTATAGTVELNGSTAQNIPANTFTSNTVHNLTINNSAGVSLDGTVIVTGVLTPTVGVLTTNGNLRLSSSAIGASAAIGIGSSSGGYISGTVDVERYSQAQRGYRTLAHPYITSQTVGQLTDNFQITGLASGALGTYGVRTGAPSALYYDGTKPVGTTSVLGRITKSDTAAWAVGKGLYVFIRGNANEGTGGSYTSSGGAPSPLTLDVTSASINQGDVTVTLTPYASGQDNYTLVGNPYPCPINLENVTNISSFGNVYVYNPTLSAGATTILRGGFEQQASKNIVIPSMGCFYIQSTETSQSTITFKESDKVATGSSTYAVFGTGTTTPKIGLAISTSAGFMDRTSIVFDKNAASTATDFYDGGKLGNNLVTFYSLSSERKALGIDYRKTNTADIIPLGIQTSVNTNYTISLSELTDLPNTQVVLRDKFLKTETILSQVGDSYSFAITADTATLGENRFEIGLLGTTVLPVQIADITAQLQTNKTVAVNWTSTSEVNLASYKVQRSKDGSNFSTVGTVAAKGASAYSYSDDLSAAGILPATIYYRLETVDKDGSKSYSKVVAVALGSSVAKAAINIYPNPVQSTLFAQVTVTKAGAAQLKVVDAQGKIVATQKTQLAVGTTSISIPAAQLAAGSYTLEIETTDGKQTQRFVKE
jgi:hypothetical protein